MKLKKIFLLSIKKFDLFAEPVSLTFNKSKKIPTKLGAILSFFLLFIVFSISNSKIESIINRSTVYIQNFPAMTDIPPENNMKNRFAFFFSPIEVTAISGKRYFDFTIEIGKTVFLENGTNIRTSENLNLVKCNVSHFPMFTEEQLIKSGIKDWVCPDYNDEKVDFSIKGTFGNPEYKFIRINIKVCSSNTNKNNESYCVSEKQYVAMKKKNPKLYFNLVLINNLIDLNDFKHPFKPKIEFTPILIEPNQTFSQNEFYIQNTTIFTDYTQSFNALRSDSEYHQEKSIMFNGKIDKFLLTDISSTGDVYASIFLRSDQIFQKYVRKYDCVQDYLQSLGSFYSIFFLLFSIINNYYSKPFKTKEIAESMYNFTDFNSEDTEKNLKRRLLIWFARKLKNVCLFLLGRTQIHGYHYQTVQKPINNDLDVTQILLSLKRLNNFKQIMITERQKMILDLTGKEKFENFALQERKKMLNFIQRLSSLNIQSGLTKAKISYFNKINDSLEELRKDADNDISKKICALFDRHNLKKNTFTISSKTDRSILPLNLSFSQHKKQISGKK